MTKDEAMKPGTIVQASPSTPWHPSLVVVEETRSWGVIGYTFVPRQGPAYIRLEWEAVEATGGAVKWGLEP